ncbi:MAG: hypothetical protein WAU36_00515 [Cyclobacteriaceae bacterium]
MPVAAADIAGRTPESTKANGQPHLEVAQFNAQHNGQSNGDTPHHRLGEISALYKLYKPFIMFSNHRYLVEIRGKDRGYGGGDIIR